MSYQVLARKWRPQVFEHIRGQEHIVRALQNAIRSERIAHAYIFTGTRGVGKTSAARVLAKALNCVEGPTPEPCNKCSACLEITAGKYPDVLEIDGASNNSVDDIRQLRDQVRYPPVSGRYRVYIIDEVHMLSTGAFNALLKTLEEPPPHVVFLFATTDPHKVPITILSRCQQYDFKKLSTRELSALLKDICTHESIEIEPAGLTAIAREAEGSVRDAQSLLDQVISYAGQRITFEDVRDVLGVTDRGLLLDVARAVVQHDVEKVVRKLDEAERFGFDAKRFAIDLMDIFRDLTVVKTVRDAEELVDLSTDEIASVADLIENSLWEELHARFDMLGKGMESLRTAPRPGIALEMLLIKMARMPALIALGDLGPNLDRAAAGRKAPERSAAQPTHASVVLPHVPDEATEPPAPARTAQKPASGENAARPAEQPAASTPIDETGGIAGSAAAASAAEPVEADDKESVPEPEAPAPSEKAGAADGASTPAPPADVLPEAVWKALVEGIPSLSRVLENNARLLRWDTAAGVLEVEVEPDYKFGFERNKPEIVKIATALAGRKVALKVVVPEGRESAAERARRQTDLENKIRREAREHPIVQKALDIFGGQIEEIKSLDNSLK